MKNQIFLYFLILLFSLSTVGSASETITLSIGESFEFQGKNIMLLNSDDSPGRAAFCVNNVKGIVDKDASRMINGASITLKQAGRDVATIKVIGDCKDCKCDESCQNLECKKIIDNSENQPEIPIGASDEDLRPSEMASEADLVKRFTGEITGAAVIEEDSSQEFDIASALLSFFSYALALVIILVIIWAIRVRR